MGTDSGYQQRLYRAGLPLCDLLADIAGSPTWDQPAYEDFLFAVRAMVR